MGKKISRTKDPSGIKEVRRVANPDSYQKSHLSWQFNSMDFDFAYGWNNVINKVRIDNIDDLELELLEKDCTDEKLFESLGKCQNKEFESYDEFLKFVRKNNTKISIDNLRIVLKHIRANYFWKYLLPKMKNLESIKWNELERETFGKNAKSKHHWVSVNDLIKEAQKRLEYLKLDDYDQLFSIRLSGTERLWGFKELSYFKILWYDFNHEICPSYKTHT